MSWTKKGGIWIWTDDGKGNPKVPGDNTTPPPSFGNDSSNLGSEYSLELGFGLVDNNGNPVSLPPIQIGPYVVNLAASNPKAYNAIKNAVSALSGRKNPDPNFVGGYLSKLATNIMASSDIIAKSGSIQDYFKATATQAAAANLPTAQQTIYDPTKAKSFVTSVFEDLLKRKPTNEELNKYTSALKAEQEKPESATKTVYKTVNGVRTAVTTTGLDEKQFLTDLLTATPEFQTRQKESTFSATQDLQKIAANNGVTLTPELLNSYLDRIKGGEDINTIKASFRDMAKLGRPDSIKKLLDQGMDLATIYSPYKNLMASTLELDPNSIDLNDKTLLSAINKDGEVPLWQFQTALRKDPRWQYTNNAKQEISNSVLKVLQDFGFRG